MSDMEFDNLRLLEAILFASAEPLSEKALMQRFPDDTDLEPLLRKLQVDYQGRGIHLVLAGKSWAFRTAADLAHRLMQEVDVNRKLGRASIETIAIIAYHQPITRTEIEEIRGVSLSKGTLDVLFEAGWVKPRGRRQTPGRPMTWGTTDEFLDHFGLETIQNLPGMGELKAAGLLDKGPAINAYRVSGEFEGETPGGGATDLFDAEENEDAMPEPLTP